MADNAPPRIFHQILAGGKAPRVSGGHAATPQQLGRQAGLAGAFRPQSSKSADDVTDPAVSGEFERTPAHTNLFGVMGGDLTPRGKEQQATSQRLQALTGHVQDLVLNQGVDPQTALREAVKQNPGALNDLVGHPQALKSVDNLFQHLGIGQASGPAYGPVDKQGRQVQYDPNTGQALGAQQVPGLEPPPGKPAPWHSTAQGFMQQGPNGTAVPVLDTEGKPVMPVPSAASQKAALGNGFTDSDAGAGPQAPEKRPDNKPAIWDQQRMTFVNAVPATMDALDTVKRLAPEVAGLGKSLVAIGAGTYVGTNPAGQQMNQAYKTIDAASTMLSGRGYKAPMANMEALAGNPSMAPSALTAFATNMQNMVRGIGQSDVDQATQHAGERLPTPQAQQLIQRGIIPNGYATQENLDKMPPGEGALWKARNVPGALTDAEKVQLVTDARNGKFGSPTDPQNANPDKKIVDQLYQDYTTQRAARQQQGVASTAAKAAQPSGVGNQPASPQPQPLPITGATEPVQPQQGQNQQPKGQEQQSQQVAVPGQGQQNGQEAQANQPQPAGQGQFLLPGTNTPLNIGMPPTAVPGQPIQGMPATNGTTPQPPPSPLPQKTSQVLTPQGNVPTPATQAPREETPLSPELAGVSASAPIPPPGQ